MRDHYREALEKNIVEKGDVIIKLREKLYTQLGDHNEKQERMIDLEEMFKSRAKEFAMTEEVIKDEINEVKEWLEILQVVKKRDWMKTKIEQDWIREQIWEVDKEIKKLLERKAWLEA